MDLKALLVEAKQKVPPVLQVLQTGDETMLNIGGETFTPNLFFIFFSEHPLITQWDILYELYKFLSSGLSSPASVCLR